MIDARHPRYAHLCMGHVELYKITKIMSEPQSKKPFDKKRWREKKYSKKFKVQQWEEKRKKAVIRQYIKELKKSKVENAAAGVSTINPSPEENRGKNEKLSAYKLAQLEYERTQEAKRKKKEEYERRKAEREEALNNYKKRKIERYKKLSKKTKKGQPVMKDRIELLLEKIQSECGPSK
ncbi:hypothetical protein J437_LFUL003252 [Ladona fulva]|uniref:Thyroid transcription factor 1-associated protein 26 n=1 Tax=Ladona fulva TaxID=123851 RepID=A0A8K0JSZ8_LADFU|nr:hypothetical protein J437_LFUL003252 [Ladona fulva]